MKKIQFTATLDSLGEHHMSVIYIPEEIMETKPKIRVRAEGFINGVPFNLAPQSQKLGPKYFMINKDLKKKILSAGNDEVLVIFEWIDANILELPEELEVVLSHDEDFKARFDTFTVGKQRSLAYYVKSAKSVDTRIKRALELAFKVKTNSLYSDKK